MALKKVYTIILLHVALMVGAFHANAQCNSSFPYIQDFEITNGGWFSGGASPDWAWGSPNKTFIKTAASGINCWVIGGITGSSYNNNEASWLQSPCFDFSSLQYPLISMNIWWESEKGFDGTSLQYSLDNGTSWKDAGSINDATDCLNNNWFNIPTVKFLGALTQSGNGWSGTSADGSGSGKWVVAKKAIPTLAGKSNVLFRFVFAAGSVANGYDGFAMDDFSVTEAPSNKADFTYACAPDNTVNFTNTSILCPKTFVWDFGDPASGINNSSLVESPAHVFSAPGTYTVTLTVSSTDNAPSTISKTITVLGISTNITKPINCFEDKNGEITATVSGAAGPFTYSWNTNPVQSTNIATGLSAGSYTITATPLSGCTLVATVVLPEPAALQHSVSIVPPGCIAPTGKATITETGGTAPYTYSWSPFGGTSATANGLTQQKYTVTVTDSRSCTDVFDVDIVNVIPPSVSMVTNDVKCFGSNDGNATATISGGADPLIFSWNTNPVQNTLSVNNLKAGDYIFTVKDANSCVVNTPVNIKEPLPITTTVQTTNTTCRLRNGSITISPSGNISDYVYTWNPPISNTNIASTIAAGKYQVQLKNSNGCTKDLTQIFIDNTGNPSRIFLGKDTVICTEEKVVLTPGIFTNYLWQDNSVSPIYTVTQTGKYWVRITNNDGCISTDTINIKVVDNCVDIYFPTTFSPNGDGLNDQFGPVGNLNAVSNYKLSVYNRWGQLVFTSDDPRKKWSGENAGQISATANYVWQASYIFKGQGSKVKKGSLIIIR